MKNLKSWKKYFLFTVICSAFAVGCGDDETSLTLNQSGPGAVGNCIENGGSIIPGTQLCQFTSVKVAAFDDQWQSGSLIPYLKKNAPSFNYHAVPIGQYTHTVKVVFSGSAEFGEVDSDLFGVTCDKKGVAAKVLVSDGNTVVYELQSGVPQFVNPGNLLYGFNAGAAHQVDDDLDEVCVEVKSAFFTLAVITCKDAAGLPAHCI